MKILLVYPETPSTFWSFKNPVKFISKKASEPPLGLITLAAMLPAEWQLKLVDMNVSSLSNAQIEWADYVFLSGMSIHRSSFKQVVKRCNEIGTPVVAGGPMVTTDYREFLGIEHFILNEAEITLPLFLKDLAEGHPQQVYQSDEFPDLSLTPVPRWDLLEQDKYAAMSIQYSRGCPYDCEFCSIVLLNGRRPRTKSTTQFLSELDGLMESGWRGSILIVDDNFIGNRRKLKNDLLPTLIRWGSERNFPFSFGTEATINLAEDDELIDMMVRAGFEHAFIGIETPNIDSLSECGKRQNLKVDMLSAVKKLHNSGIRVSAGFIIGFDNDPADIFERQINFIKNSGIVTAMVGLLNAPAGTKLFKRLHQENRLLQGFGGDNMDGSINFIPRMSYQNLIKGYKKVLDNIYSQKEYYERVKNFLADYQPRFRAGSGVRFQDILAFLKSLWILGVREKGKRYYWKLIITSLLRHPRKFPMAVTMAIYGFHFRQVVKTV